jgi:hypothetical protein
VPPLLPRFLEGHAERAAHAKALEQIVREAGGNIIEEKRKHAPSAADAHALRGLPAIGPGVAGVIKGTSPHGWAMSQDGERD